MQKIRFLEDHLEYKKGRIYEVQNNDAASLIQIGIASLASIPYSRDIAKTPKIREMRPKRQGRGVGYKTK